MSLFRNVSMAIKLPILMVLLTVFALTVTTIIAFTGSRSELRNQAEHRLAIAATAKSAAVGGWVDGILRDLDTQSGNPTVSMALLAFTSAYQAVPAPDKTAYLKRLYITENPHSAGERANLDKADDGSAYSAAHGLYHSYFRSLVRSRGYDDVFLFDRDGNLIYSVSKLQDFATNLVTGAYGSSGLGEAFGAVTSGGDAAATAFADFAPYAPASGKPAAFVASRVVDPGGRLLGVIAFQMPTDGIERVVNESPGLGDEGEARLIGSDMTRRSSGGFDITQTALSPVAESGALRASLAGEAAVERRLLDNGEPGIEATVPVRFMDVPWALSLVEPMRSIDAPAHALLRSILIKEALALALIAAVCIFVARSISRPIDELERSMRSVSGGDLDGTVPHTARRDEIGHMACALEEFRLALKDARALQTENTFKGAAFNGSSAALMMVDANFEIAFMNEAVRTIMRDNTEFFGQIVSDFDAENMIGANMDIFHRHPGQIRKLIDNPANLPFEANIPIADKRFKLYISAIFDTEGKHLGNVVEWQDVTESSLNRSILDAINSHQCTAQFTPDGRFEKVNDNLASTLSRGGIDLVGKPHSEIFRFDSAMARERGPVWDRLCAGESIYGKFRVQTPAGEDRWLEGGFSPVMDRGKIARRIAFMATDVTEAETTLSTAEAHRKAMAEAQAQVVDTLRVALNHLADGDLTTRIDNRFGDEYEQLRTDFNLAMERLLDAMRGVIDNAESIRNEAGEISSAADDLSRRTEKQAATLEQTAAALDQLTSSVKSAADGAAQANDVVLLAKSNAEASGIVVRDAVAAMGEIETSSEQISKIISVIDDIAFQTNLLALNAGVEAARAGEAGRGFAVVASEVRALAQRSSDAAREINDLISASTIQVKRGVELVGQTGEALKEIVCSVTDISTHVGEIAISSKEQSTGLGEINTAVNQLDQVTQQNAAMFEETTAASHALTREAETLSATMAHFRTGAADPAQAARAEPAANAAAAPADRGAASARPRPSPMPRVDGNAALAEQPGENDGWEDF